MQLKESSLLVTGGANGLGLGIVKRLIEEGCKVSVLDKDKEAIQHLVNLYPEIVYAVCDLTKFDEVSDAIHSILREVNVIHGLINNAGIIKNAALVNLLSKDKKNDAVKLWHEIIAHNLSSVFYVTQNVAEHMVLMRTKGVIINIASIAANGNAGQTAYSAAKAGLIGMTKTWAKELGPLGIRSLAISPGFLDTPSTKAALNENQIDNLIKATPLRRIGTISQIADAIIFVCKNDFYNGKVLEIDGGLVF